MVDNGPRIGTYRKLSLGTKIFENLTGQLAVADPPPSNGKLYGLAAE